MIDPDVIRETQERFAARSAERAENQARLARGESPLQIDTTERAALRIERLAAAASREIIGEKDSDTSDVTIQRLPDTSALERIIGQSNLLPVNFLGIGAIFARSVGRIRLRERGQTVGFGTGFLVSPRLLLTNHHVLHTAEEAAAALVEFNYQVGVNGRFGPIAAFALQPDVFFLTDKALDFTLVAVGAAADGQPLAPFDGIRLIEEEGKIIVGEFVNIIQHPNGEPKQVAVQENQVVDVLPDFLHYQTDTAPGSSGSAVANNQWEVVALHHSGVPREDDQGRWLTKSGTIWKPAMGETAVDWIANEGVRVSRIIAHLKAQTLLPVQQELLNEMFAPAAPPASSGRQAQSVAVPPSPKVEPTITANAAVSIPSGDTNRRETNTITLTVPIQITVQIGDIVTATFAESQRTKNNHP